MLERPFNTSFFWLFPIQLYEPEREMTYIGFIMITIRTPRTMHGKLKVLLIKVVIVSSPMIIYLSYLSYPLFLQFYLEEAKGRVDYQGYILPRRHGEIVSNHFSFSVQLGNLYNSVISCILGGRNEGLFLSISSRAI